MCLWVLAKLSGSGFWVAHAASTIAARAVGRRRAAAVKRFDGAGGVGERGPESLEAVGRPSTVRAPQQSLGITWCHLISRNVTSALSQNCPRVRPSSFARKAPETFGPRGSPRILILRLVSGPNRRTCLSDWQDR